MRELRRGIAVGQLAMALLTPDMAVGIGKAAVIAAVPYAALSFGAHRLSGSLIFPCPPPSYELGPDYFLLTSPDGVRVACRFWENPDARYTILWFHGNGEDLGTIADTVDSWRKEGFAILALDYRGYGRSEGSPSEETVYADAAMAFEWLRAEKRLPHSRIIVMGYSLGSGPAVEIATREPVAGLILQAPFVSTYRVMTRIPLFPGDKFRNLAKINRLKCPLLVIHGTADRTVPFWHGRKLLEAATVRKEHLWVEGAGHTDIAAVAGDSFWAAVRHFSEALRKSGTPGTDSDRDGEGSLRGASIRSES